MTEQELVKSAVERNVEVITSLEAYLRLCENKNKIMRVDFIKRTTGEYRKMICRNGVTKGVKGVGMNFDPVAKRLKVVWDMQKKNFRMINLNGLKWIKINGQEPLIA